MAEDSDRFELEQCSSTTGQKTRIILRNDNVIIGRNPDAEVPVNSRSVSRRHAILKKGANSWTLIDNSSANGVYLQGKKIAPNKPFVLQEGQKFCLAEPALAEHIFIFKRFIEPESSSSSQPSVEILCRVHASGTATSPRRRTSMLNNQKALKNSQKKQRMLQEDPNEIDVTESLSPALSQHIRNTISSVVKKKIESAPESFVEIGDCIESGANSSTKRKFLRLSMSSQKKKSKRCLTKEFESNSVIDEAKNIEFIDLTVTDESCETQSKFDNCTEEKTKRKPCENRRLDLIQRVYEKDIELQATKRELERKNTEVCDVKTNLLEAQDEIKKLKNDLKIAKEEAEKNLKDAEDTKKALEKTKEEIKANLEVAEVGLSGQTLNNRLSIEDFECSICLQPVNRATVLNCGHLFCKACIATWEEQNRDKCCPYCKQQFDRATYVCLIESLMEKIMTPQQREEKRKAMKKHDEEFSKQLELRRNETVATRSVRSLRSGITDSPRTVHEIIVSSEDERQSIRQCIYEMILPLLMGRASSDVPSSYFTFPLNTRLIINDIVERLRQFFNTQISVRMPNESSRNENLAPNFNPLLPGPSNIQHGTCYHCNEYGHDFRHCPYRQP